MPRESAEHAPSRSRCVHAPLSPCQIPGAVVLRSRLGTDDLGEHELAAGCGQVTHLLLYYHSPEKAMTHGQPTGAIPIARGKTTVTEAVEHRKPCLQIYTPGGQRKFFIVPEDPNGGWIDMVKAPPPPHARIRPSARTLTLKFPVPCPRPEGKS